MSAQSNATENIMSKILPRCMIIMDNDTHFSVWISQLSIVSMTSVGDGKHIMLDHTATHHSLTNTDKPPDQVRFKDQRFHLHEINFPHREI